MLSAPHICNPTAWHHAGGIRWQENTSGGLLCPEGANSILLPSCLITCSCILGRWRQGGNFQGSPEPGRQMKNCLLVACLRTGNLPQRSVRNSHTIAPHKTAYLSKFQGGIQPRTGSNSSWTLPVWPTWRRTRSPECHSRAILLYLDHWKGGWLDLIFVICTFFTYVSWKCCFTVALLSMLVLI